MYFHRRTLLAIDISQYCKVSDQRLFLHTIHFPNIRDILNTALLVKLISYIMDVELYVYDLSKGVARAMSRQFLGVQIDAVYHTSLVFGNIEYLYGAGVQTCYPASSHHGQPMQILKQGKTELPLEDILEYLESLKQVYTAESYDLFTHNCNNFTNDLLTFLVGKGIPPHITSLPQTVLNTPFGQMIKSQLDASIRTVTQAPIPAQNIPSRSVDPANAPSRQLPTQSSIKEHGQVYNVTEQSVLDKLLSEAKSSASVIFFTSSTCAPCKIAYPTYDALAAEYPALVLIKVDINQAHDIASKYQIRATPTFMTYLKAKKDNEWTGADPALLRGNVALLVRQAFPPHPHAELRVPAIAHGSLTPLLFARSPPLDKLMDKLGSSASAPCIAALKSFIETRTDQGAKDAPLPDLAAIGSFMCASPSTLPPDSVFAAYDLLRCAMADPRVSGYFVEESKSGAQTLQTLHAHVTSLIETDTCPYNLRLVTLQLGCNLFSSTLSRKVTLSNNHNLATPTIQMCTSGLLVESAKPALYTAASSLAFNLASANYRVRREEKREALVEGTQVELCAGLLKALGRLQPGSISTELVESTRLCLLSLGYLVHFAPMDGEVADLCRAMDARSTIQELSSCKELASLAADVAKCLPET